MRQIVLSHIRISIVFCFFFSKYDHFKCCYDFFYLSIWRHSVLEQDKQLANWSQSQCAQTEREMTDIEPTMRLR